MTGTCYPLFFYEKNRPSTIAFASQITDQSFSAYISVTRMEQFAAQMGEVAVIGACLRLGGRLRLYPCAALHSGLLHGNAAIARDILCDG